ncbi:hypothetical protein M2306_002049 [Myroides gitamensis]|uniref:hypothetical protein n=1 Tax=Myroides odoratus TaxID=256 RepID=UPI0021681501|nr:hypothetical protein [Myroides odoratus]MCS4239508.1 hypothetical protein [Myroides odoratus]MDH6601355.1 hypothetical protein [Myroides gitamensis]
MENKKCFIVKLDTVIDNASAPILGGLRFTFKPTGNSIRTVVALNTSEPVVYKIIGPGNFLNSNGTVIGKEMTTQNGLILSDDTREILMTDKYKLTQFRGVESNMSLAFLDINTSDFKYCPLRQLISSNIVGDLKNLPPTITKLTISSSFADGFMTGDFTSLLASSDAVNDGYISIVGNGDLISCDISKLSQEKQTNLLRLILEGINITGEVTNLDFRHLNFFRAHNTLLKGNMKCFNNSKITSLEASSAALTGDIALLPATCKLVRLSNQSVLTYSSSSVNRTDMVILHRVTMDTESIDRYLQDMAILNKPIGSTLGILIYGTRTSASDAAMNTIISKGVTVALI